MAALTTLNITEKNANNSLSVTVKVNVTEFAVPLFKAGAEWRIGSVWHPITVIPECYRLVIFIPKKVGMTKRLPVMGMLEENKIFVSSRPGCILFEFYEMESWAYLDDLLP